MVRLTDEIDHIIPLAFGGSDTEDNIQGLCAECHRDKSSTEGASAHAAAFHPQWLKPSAIPVTIVCGPPASGKTTYVKANAAPGDTIIDLDAIMVEIDPGFSQWSAISKTLVQSAIRKRNSMLSALSRSAHGRAWFIVSAPSQQERDWWSKKLNGTVILLNPGMEECIRRARARGTERAVQGIEAWERNSTLPWQAKAPAIKGNDASGKPKDPAHPWNR